VAFHSEVAGIYSVDLACLLDQYFALFSQTDGFPWSIRSSLHLILFVLCLDNLEGKEQLH
jgi:hypothetical protein